ncbi:hypothetical protein [Nitrosomonas communis]|uniref:DUF1640 domain-containing protein n=1 Tax=Nitrosomonas communis TaxID=44574 RepID=A0A1I4RW06_9PROT|nr:hypothetical protein [Nitrosomonas communis]SFM56339.1 hypothetical protein SAMN05421863_103545 [Nitrosomonas communis]
MTTLTFDTLKFANTLKEAGVPSAQAEAEARALADVLEVNLKDLATKQDLLATEEKLRWGIEDLRREMDSRLIQLEQRLIIKLGALMTIAVSIVAALVKLL